MPTLTFGVIALNQAFRAGAFPAGAGAGRGGGGALALHPGEPGVKVASLEGPKRRAGLTNPGYFGILSGFSNPQ